MFTRLKILIFGRIHFDYNGLNFERFLKQLLAGGIILYDIKRGEDGRKISASVDFLNYRKLLALSSQLCYDIKVTKGYGLLCSFSKSNFRISFVLGICFFCASIIVFNSFIWRVDINGLENVPESEIRQVLSSSGIKRGSLTSKLDADDLERNLLHSINKIGAVSISRKGISVIINVTELDEPNYVRPDGINLISGYEGIVTNIVVFSGTPLVAINETVRVGEILVSGTEQTPADGYVTMRIFLSASTTVYDTEIAFERTGRSIDNSYFNLFSRSFASKSMTVPFAHYEQETTSFYAFKSFVPLKRVKQTFYELKEVVKINDFAAMQENVIKKTKQSILMPIGAKILNERVQITQALGSNTVTAHLELEIVLSA